MDEPTYNFGGLPPHLCDFKRSKILIWPVPFEKTVSYGRGTAEGPAAILDASRYVELYDEEIDREPAAVGIHTLPPVNTDLDPDQMMEVLYQQSREHLKSGKFLCMLGGEHSISSPVVRAHRESFERLSVLQIDAHADLRDSYEGSRWSHASAMRRIVEICPAVQVGIRSLSIEEARAIPILNTRVFYAKDIAGRTGWIDDVVNALTEDVYLTFDVDGLDPSIVPSTGTPEPGGLLWYETLELLKTVAARRRVVGMDVVELCRPSEGNGPSFLTAKLIYKTLGYIFRQELLGRD